MTSSNRMEILSTAVHQIANCIDSVNRGTANWEDVKTKIDNLICIYLYGRDVSEDDVKFSVSYMDGKLFISSKVKITIKYIGILIDQIGKYQPKIKDIIILVSEDDKTADNKEKVSAVVDTFGFDTAISILKTYRWVSRLAWCSDGHIRVVLQKGYPDGINCNKQTAEAWGIQEGDIFKVEPYFQISTEDGSHHMWFPNTADCLAEDWYTI